MVEWSECRWCGRIEFSKKPKSWTCRKCLEYWASIGKQMVLSNFGMYFGKEEE